MPSFNFTSHASEVKAAKDAAVKKALEMIGLQAEGYAKENITRVGAVDTGRLRNSITHAAEGDDTQIRPSKFGGSFNWISTFLAFSSMKLAGIVMLVGCILCVPVLPFVYSRIYKRYKKNV